MEKTAIRAALIAASPGMYDALLGVLEVFQVIAEHGDEPSSLAAQDMLPVIESAIEAANGFGAVNVDTLQGP